MMETPEQMEARHQREWEDVRPDGRPSAASIMAMHARRSGYTVGDFKGKGKHRHLAHARQDCMADIRKRTGYSAPQIGRMFNRDHTTVLHALRAVEGRAG